MKGERKEKRGKKNKLSIPHRDELAYMRYLEMTETPIKF